MNSSHSPRDSVLELLCSLLCHPPPKLSIPPSTVSPSPLLTSLVRAACYIDLTTDRREVATQTHSHHVSSSPKHTPAPSHKEEEYRHKKRKRKKESRPKKKKKEKRRKKHYCSSPSYSDYEPENPILRRKLRAKIAAQKQVEETENKEKVPPAFEKERKKRKHKRRSRSESAPRSRTRSRSRSSSRRQSRSKERKRKKKKRKLSPSFTDEKNIADQRKDQKAEEDKTTETRNATPVSSEPVWEKHSPPHNGTNQANPVIENCKETKDNPGEIIDCENVATNGNIIFSKIEDIPTRTESPKWFENESMKKKAFHEVKIVETKKKDPNTSRLKFEINFPQKRLPLVTPTASTFAELSNKLGPTHSLSSRKIGIHPLPKVDVKLPPVTPIKPKIDKPVLKPAAPKVTEEKEPEIVHIEDVNGNEKRSRSYTYSRSRSRTRSGSRSRSMSWSRSRSRSVSRSRSRSYSYYSYSRSRSYSYSSYSRSRSRSRSYSRSRSRSYSSYSSRSRSRTRSPSIPRRRGSPSFLDKRRITSARKRPIPYHRATPSPSPSHSSTDDGSGSQAGSRSRSRSRKPDVR